MDHPFGSHALRLDGDVAWVTYRGDLTLAELQELCRRLDEAAAEHGYVIMVVDSTAAGTLPAEGRRFMASWLNATLSQGIFISAGAVPRAMVRMIDTAAEHLGGRERQPLYVGSAAEANELIPEIRAHLSSQIRRSKPSL